MIAFRRLKAVWMSLQVELQGSYSADRLYQLHNYSNRTSDQRLIFVLLMTPMPCIVVSLLKELLPLKPIEAGVYENWVFFVRSWIVAAIIGENTIMLLKQGAPRLMLTARQMILIASFASAVSIIIIAGISTLTVFPFPFGVILAGVPLASVGFLCLHRILGPQWRADPSLWAETKQVLTTIHCQMSLPFIYPLYIYGFVSLTGTDQVLFVAVLPIIKLIARNWMNLTLRRRDDIKPEAIIFTVEIFNALYISSALQSSSSWTSTISVMALDVVGFWVSMIDITKVLKGLKKLMEKIPQDHPLANENFIQLSLIILASRDANKDRPNIQESGSEASIFSTNTKTLPCKAEDQKSEPTYAILMRNNAEIQKHPRSLLFQSAQVTPMCIDENQHSVLNKSNEMVAVNPNHAIDIEAFFSRAEQDHFIQKSTHVLFITEYVVLMEYVEVMVPILYCVYRVVLFYLPNSVYYPSLAGLSGAQLSASTFAVLAYSSLEFLSFVVSTAVMKRTLGFNPIQQLGFVLEAQADSIQTKLMGIFIYVTQMPLVHLGADFSFKFAWLHGNQTK